MNPLLHLAIPACVALSCAGCIIVSTSKSSPPPPPVNQPARRVVVVESATSDDSLTLAEINAAVKLDFEGSRLNALTAIATRPNLCPCTQVRLVDAAYDSLDFEGSKLNLLSTLVHQKAFCNPAKERILVRLHELDFEGSRVNLLAAMNQRGRLE